MKLNRAAIFHHLQKNTEICRRAINPTSLCLTVIHSAFYFGSKKCKSFFSYARIWRIFMELFFSQKGTVKHLMHLYGPKYEISGTPNFFYIYFHQKVHYVNDCKLRIYVSLTKYRNISTTYAT